MNSDRLTFQPNWASPPGDSIREALHRQGLTLSDFAAQASLTASEAQEVLNGVQPLTLAVARAISSIAGASLTFWLTRDHQYREDAQRLSGADARWLRAFPISDMVAFGWIKHRPEPARLAETILDFFGVDSHAQWQRVYGSITESIAFRTSRALESNPLAVAAWLRQGQIQAQSTPSRTWDRTVFEEALPEIRPLSRIKEPSKFLPRLRKICGEAGVAVEVVRAPSGCRASGGAISLDASRKLILLSFRHLSDDHFWFTFFHEAGHLLLHDSTDGFVDEELSSELDNKEAEANAFAKEVLVPSEYDDQLRRARRSSKALPKLASDLAISPGLLVGQLQFSGELSYTQMNFLKRRYSWTPED